MPERGCGRRRKGLYLEVASGPNGLPLEHFLLDPPVIPEDFDFASLPNKTRFLDGTSTVMHWVGQEYYPYCPDMIEELKNMGGSFRIPLTFDVERLAGAGVSRDRNGEPMLGARLLLAHAKCYNALWAEQSIPKCDKKIEEHETIRNLAEEPYQPDTRPLEGPCLFKCYDLIPVEAGTSIGDGLRMRSIGSTPYPYNPSGESAKGLQPAFFAALPLRGIAAIRGDMSPAEEQQWERARAKAREAGVPVRTLRLAEVGGQQVEIED